MDAIAQKLYNPQLVNPFVNWDFAQYGSRLVTVLMYIFIVACILAFFFSLIWGGREWITSGGDKQKLEFSRSRLTNAITGLVILFILFLVIRLVNSFFGIGFGGGGLNPELPPVPNCKNLSCPSQIVQGSTGLFSVTYEDYGADLTDMALAIYPEGVCEGDAFKWLKLNVTGTPAPINKNWEWDTTVGVTPALGVYDVDCRAWYDGISECRGRCVAGALYQCAGPSTSCKVSVVANVTPTITPTPMVTMTPTPMVTMTPTPTPIINSASGEPCKDYCERKNVFCGSIGIDSNSVDGTWYSGESNACFPETERLLYPDDISGYYQCTQPMQVREFDCGGIQADWTGCNCTNGMFTQSVWGKISDGSTKGYLTFRPVSGLSEDYPGYPDFSRGLVYWNRQDKDGWYGPITPMIGSDTIYQVDAQSEVFLPDAGDCGKLKVSYWTRDELNVVSGYYTEQSIYCKDKYEYTGYPNYVVVPWNKLTDTPAGLDTVATQAEVLLPLVDNVSGITSCGAIMTSVWGLKNGSYEGYLTYVPLSCTNGEPDYKNMHCPWGANTWCGPYSAFGPQGSEIPPAGSVLDVPIAESQVFFPHVNRTFSYDSNGDGTNDTNTESCGVIGVSDWGKNNGTSTVIGYSTYVPVACEDEGGVLVRGRPYYNDKKCFWNSNKWCGPFSPIPNPDGTYTELTSQSEAELPIAKWY